MTDPDQEGEVIAHDVARSLRQLPAERQPLAVTRVKVYEITRDGVAAAMQRKSGIEPATALPGSGKALLGRAMERVVWGKRLSVRVECGGSRRLLKKEKI